MRSTAVCGTLVLIACGLATGRGFGREAAADQETQKTVRSRIADLASSDKKARDDAQNQIVKIGEAAVPLLRQAMYHRDAQVRRLADETMSKIRPGAVWNRKVREKLKTKSVSISMKDAPLSQVLVEIGRQGDLDLALSPHVQRAMQENVMPVSIEVKEYNLELALVAALESKKLTYSLAHDGVMIEGGQVVRSELLKTALSEKVPPLKLRNATLAQAVDQIKPSVFLGLALDRDAFAKEAEAKFAVNLTTERPLRLETVLSLLLEGHDLGFVFDERRLLITTKEKAADERVTVDYEIQDMLTALKERNAMPDAEQQLTDTIRECVDRLSWRTGEVGIRIHEGKLTVTQRRSVHGRIEQFLKAVEVFEGVRHGEVGEVLEF